MEGYRVKGNHAATPFSFQTFEVEIWCFPPVYCEDAKIGWSVNSAF